MFIIVDSPVGKIYSLLIIFMIVWEIELYWILGNLQSLKFIKFSVYFNPWYLQDIYQFVLNL